MNIQSQNSENARANDAFCSELVSPGRQAAMSRIAPEFLNIGTTLSFLKSRHTPRMSAQDAAGASS